MNHKNNIFWSFEPEEINDYKQHLTVGKENAVAGIEVFKVVV